MESIICHIIGHRNETGKEPDLCLRTEVGFVYLDMPATRKQRSMFRRFWHSLDNRCTRCGDPLDGKRTIYLVNKFYDRARDYIKT